LTLDLHILARTIIRIVKDHHIKMQDQAGRDGSGDSKLDLNSRNRERTWTRTWTVMVPELKRRRLMVMGTAAGTLMIGARRERDSGLMIAKRAIIERVGIRVGVRVRRGETRSCDPVLLEARTGDQKRVIWS
jgi:hypothetical protein